MTTDDSSPKPNPQPQSNSDEIEEEKEETVQMRVKKEIKKKKKNKSKKKEKVGIIRKFRNLCGFIVLNTYIQYSILAMIIVNAIMMGINTYDFVENDENLSASFDLVDTIFLIIFTVELVLQIIYHGFALFKDNWLIFDFLTIVSSWSLSQFQVIRTFRIFRALRLITKIKVLRNLVLAIFSILPRMGAIIMLMILLMYIFAVMFTALFKKNELEGEPFRNLGLTFFTLFQFMTLDWAEITRELTIQVSWARYPIMIFVLASGFIVYNLIIAVLCNAIFELREIEKENEKAEEDSILNDEDGPRLRAKIESISNRIYKLEASQIKIYSYIEEMAQSVSELEALAANQN